MGTTPMYVCLKRAEPYMVQIELQVFKPYQAQLVPTVSGWVFGNLVFEGVIGIAVDAVTGSKYKLSLDQLHACLVSEDNQVISHLKTEENCEVMVLSKADPSWEDRHNGARLISGFRKISYL